VPPPLLDARDLRDTARPPTPNPHAGRFILEAAVFSGGGLDFPYATFPDEPPSISIPIQGRLFVRLPWERHLQGLSLGGEVSYDWETLMALGYRYELSREWFADLLLGRTRKLGDDDQPVSEQQAWLFVGARLGWVRRFGPLRVGVALTAGASEKMTSLSGQVFLGFRLF